MTRGQTAKAVRERKAENPNLYCPRRDCLYKSNGELCPRHTITELDRDFNANVRAYNSLTDKQESAIVSDKAMAFFVKNKILVVESEK